MKRLTEQMMCGNCGGITFNMSFGEINHTQPEFLKATCTKCGSTTIITLQASLRLEFGEDSEGVLCPCVDHEVLKEEVEDIEKERG